MVFSTRTASYLKSRTGILYSDGFSCFIEQNLIYFQLNNDIVVIEKLACLGVMALEFSINLLLVTLALPFLPMFELQVLKGHAGRFAKVCWGFAAFSQ